MDNTALIAARIARKSMDVMDIHKRTYGLHIIDNDNFQSAHLRYATFFCLELVASAEAGMQNAQYMMDEHARRWM